MTARAGALALILAAVPGAVAGQGLAERVAEVEEAIVRFAFETRPDVEICRRGIRMGEDRHMIWEGGSWGDTPLDCRFGPAEVELDVVDGMVRDVEVVIPRRGRASRAVDLGLVPAGEVVAFLRDVALGAGTDHGAKEAVFPMVLADVDDVWRPLLDIAMDRRVPSGARKNALFWVGQEAADAATEGLTDVARDRDEDQDVRDAAVFALSQRPAEESVPVLMELARDADRAGTRRTAMFWLAQSEDARVAAFFEEILLGRVR